MAMNNFIKKGQMQVAQAVKKVNHLTLTSYDITLLLHALCRIEENFPKKFKYETNIAGYDGTLGMISIYVQNAHEITKILTLIDTCEEIGGKLLSKDLDYSASVTNHSEQVTSYEEIPIAMPSNPFIRGWRGLSVDDKKEFLKAFELLDKGSTSDLQSVKAGIAASTLTVEQVYSEKALPGGKAGSKGEGKSDKKS